MEEDNLVSAQVIVSDKNREEIDFEDSFEKDLIDQCFDEAQIPSGKTLQEEELKELNEIERSRESNDDEVDLPDIPFKELVLNFEKHLEDQHREIDEIQNRPSFQQSSQEEDEDGELSRIEISNDEKVDIFEEEDIETKKLIQKLNLPDDDDDDDSLPTPPTPKHESDILDISDPRIDEVGKGIISDSIILPTEVYEDLQTVKQLFLENGFHDIEMEKEEFKISHLSLILKNVQSLFLDYKKRGRVLDSVDENKSSEVDHHRRRNQSLETELEKVKTKNRTQISVLSQKIHRGESKIRNEKKKNLTEKKKLSSEVLRLRKTNQNLRHKNQELTHSLKTEESKIKRLQSDLVTSQKMNSSSLRRAEKLFTQYYKKKPRPTDPKHQKEVQLVRFLNHKLQNTKKHVRFLEKKVNELSSRGKKGGNVIGGYVKTISPATFNHRGIPIRQGQITTTRPSQQMRTPSPPSPRRKVNMNETKTESSDLRNMSETVSGLRLELEGLKQERTNDVQDLEQKLRNSVDRIKSVEWENQEMVKELQSRPTMEMYESLKGKYKSLLQKARSSQASFVRDFEGMDISKDELTKEKKYLKEQTAKKMILRILEVLELERAGDVIPTLKKTRLLVKAIPKLRNFVYRVLKIVRDGQKYLSKSSFITSSKERKRNEETNQLFQFISIPSRDVNSKVVPGILENWVSLLMELQSYKDMEKKMIHTLTNLRNRNNRGSGFSDSSFQYISSDISHGILKKKILTTLYRLVEESNKHRSVDETFKFLEGTNPQGVHGKLLEHFMRLFEVKKINGVLAKMNHLYRTTNELRNMLNILREIFELPRNCGLKEIVQHAQRSSGENVLDGLVQL